MAHYYATCQGHRGEATRCGAKSSGITATANSWDVGAEITIRWSNELNTDVVTIYRTNGSNSRGTRLMSYANINGKFTIIDHSHPEALI